MNWINRIYDALVNRVPGVRQRYQLWRNSHDGVGRIQGWGYLFLLNFRYHILRDKRLGRLHADASADDRISVPDEPESAGAFSMTPAELAAELQKADVISFDVFDTLIFRPFREPADLFYELSRRLRYPGLKQLRMEGEQIARAKLGGSREVTFEEIWNEVERLTGIPSREGMEAEWRTELDACFANPYFQEVLRLLKPSGAKLLICSDMYLGQTRILKLLEHCGFVGFDGCFVSCDHRTSKSEGGLFDVIREIYGPDLSYAHVGDNPHADVKQARSRKIAAIHYPNVNTVGRKYRCTDISPLVGSAYAGIVNTHLYQGLHRYSAAYELGFVYGGLFVTGYCQFIHAYAQQHGVERLLFLARDGEILHKAYCRLYPEDADRCAYVYWSRLAATKLCADRYRQQFKNQLIHYKADGQYALSRIMQTMELEDMLREFLEENPGIREEDPLTPYMAELLCQYLERNWDQVTAHYHDQRLEAERYYRQVLSGAKTAAAIDVGWVGNGPLMLRWLVEDHWKLGCSVQCMVAGTVGANSQDLETSEADLADGSMVSYLFSSMHNRDIWRIHDSALGHNMLVELLLCSTHPSFRGFTKDPDGNYSFSTHREQIPSDEVQAGVLDFVELFSRRPWNELQISGRDAMAPIKILYQNSQWIRTLIRESDIRANVE